MRSASLRRLSRAVVVLALILLSFYAFRESKTSPLRLGFLSEDDKRLISPQSYKYIHNQPRICSERSEILVVFLVPVSPRQVEAREAVRKTWGAPGPDTLTLFFVGSDGDAEIQGKVEEESRQHGDIIQMDFVDSYQNLTIKTLMCMHWLSVHCPQSLYGMKVDADIFVNIFYLKKYLRQSPRTDFVTGSVISDGTPRRDSKSKWHISERDYIEDAFPPYVSGAGYVFSRDVAGRVSWVSQFVRPVPLEDVYVGLCLRALGVSPQYAYSLGAALPFVHSLFEVRSLEYDRCGFAKLILVNGFSLEKLVDAWRDFTHGYKDC
ncbi:unnamed protein product [Knipowitschia caucasica]